ncbi:MAG: hypothetical protein CMH98_11205 [Oceanospirillaceae bacterium]|nr:hypothetical protein [Oceanospirillaceae bacterium]
MLSNKHLLKLAQAFQIGRSDPYSSEPVLMIRGGHAFLDAKNALPATVEFTQDQVEAGAWFNVPMNLAGVEVFEVVSVLNQE